MTVVPGCVWHTMHWLVGMALVNLCSIGWPLSFFGMVGSGPWPVPRLPYLA